MAFDADTTDWVWTIAGTRVAAAFPELARAI
jgi:hypothetical protein